MGLRRCMARINSPRLSLTAYRIVTASQLRHPEALNRRLRQLRRISGTPTPVSRGIPETCLGGATRRNFTSEAPRTIWDLDTSISKT